MILNIYDKFCINPSKLITKFYKIKLTMKKSPIKVVVRLRPTSNFAQQQMTVD